MTAPTRRHASDTGDRPPAPGSPRSGLQRPAGTISVGLRAPTLVQLVGVQIALAAGFAIGTLFGVPSVTISAVVLPVAVLPFVVVAGRTVLEWSTTVVRYMSGSVPSTGATSEHTRADGTPVGVHWRGDRASCVVELRPPDGQATRLGRSIAQADSTLDLGLLAQSFHQHDIVLDGIDVVSHGTRTASGTPATDVYERLIGPLPAVATRTVWVVVTVDLRANSTAVRTRGDGRLGGARTVSIATERVVRALESRGVDARVLARNEIRAAAAHVCRGVAFDSLTENWRSAPLPGVIHTGVGMDVRTLDDENLADVWAVPALSTTVVLRMMPSRTEGEVATSGSCMFVTRTTIPRPRLPGKVSMNGRQRQALLTSLPLAITARGFDSPIRHLARARVSDLRIPTAGCGQLLGSDLGGHGVALRIHGPGVGTVFVAGELYLAQQLVFRAIATGARVVLRTDRPHAWGPLVDSVATPDRLRIDGGPHRGGPTIDLVVHDFSDDVSEARPTRHDGFTILTLAERSPRTPMTDPHVSIVQPGAVGDRIHVRTARHDLELVLVTIPQETAFIGRPRSLRNTARAYVDG